MTLTLNLALSILAQAAMLSITSATYEQLLPAYTNVYDESVDADVTVERGQVPAWLQGVFLRQSCGAFGSTGSQDADIDRITHAFDCIPMGTSFKFQDSRVSFYNRFYDTETVNIYKNTYNMSLEESGNYLPSVLFSEYTQEDRMRHVPDYADSEKVPLMPHVTWWQIGDKVAAYTEDPTGFDVNIHDVEVLGRHEYDDTNFGYDEPVRYYDNPAHEHLLPDGTIYSNAIAMLELDSSTRQQWRLVYSIQNNTRTPFVEIATNDLDLTLCQDGLPYPIMEDRLGYMHSFAMTENYIILPETSYRYEPCGAFVYDLGEVGLFEREYRWESDAPSVLTVINRQTVQVEASIETDSFFTTHQLNAFEEDGLIHIDMVAYNNSDIYEVHFFVEGLLDNSNPYVGRPERFTIDTASWSLLERRYLLPEASYEFPCINYAYNSRAYTYAYLLVNSYFDLPQSLIKLNVATGEVVEYSFPEGVYPQEPWFVASPDAVNEDDGVILMQGLDGTQEKGFLTILDARDLSEIAYVIAPELLLFGLHNKFFPLDIGLP